MQTMIVRMIYTSADFLSLAQGWRKLRETGYRQAVGERSGDSTAGV
jgi:hypothetical protein